MGLGPGMLASLFCFWATLPNSPAPSILNCIYAKVHWGDLRVFLAAQRAAAQQAADAATGDAVQTGRVDTDADDAVSSQGNVGASVQRDSISTISAISDTEPTPPPADAAYHRVRLVIAGVPAGKIADVNRGIFLPLSNLADGGLTFTLEIDVTSAEGVPQRTLEQTIKETVRQIGARLVAEETE